MDLNLDQQLAVAEFLAQHFAGVRKTELNPEAAEAMDIGERRAAKFGGRRAAWVSMPTPATRASVKNDRAFLAWVRKNLPDEIETVEQVREGTRKRLLDMAKAGGWPDPSSGERITIPGVEISPGDPSVRVEMDSAAMEVIGAAWRSGEIDLGAMLALAAPEPVSAPAEVLEAGPVAKAAPALPDPVPSFFSDEHGFLDPEMAAEHAIHVQRGFSTPPIEAYRMVRDGGVGRDRALAWMEKHGLDPADPRDGKDTAWPLPDAAAEPEATS
jgi:hypothetical protein